jgi:hypothetical protein
MYTEYDFVYLVRDEKGDIQILLFEEISDWNAVVCCLKTTPKGVVEALEE